ncbi:MAG: CRISPR system precrRNA processing endoribonuclease RAMP protein Cas6 [Lachnospiraceae bacterium]
MSKNQLEECLNIRYTTLRFCLQFTENTEIVKYKSSALRGGIGEMLLRSHCIADRECEKCGFINECIVQRIMYAKMERLPDFMHSGDGVGYMIECPDEKCRFQKGECMEFLLTLFGKNIVYFSQYLHAIYILGNIGIGTNKSKYKVISIKNFLGEEILKQDIVYMKNYKYQTVNDYVNARLKEKGTCTEGKIIFEAPVTIKYQGEFIQIFIEEAIKASLLRRIYILDCFEMTEQEIYQPETEFPEIIFQKAEQVKQARYSNRKDNLMYLRGIQGIAELAGISGEWERLLLAGEVLHIGKNTSFGFGRFRFI